MMRLVAFLGGVWGLSILSLSSASSFFEQSCSAKESNDSVDDIKKGLHRGLLNPMFSAMEPIIDSTVLAAVASLAGCATHPHLLCSIAFLPKKPKKQTKNTNGLQLGRWQEPRVAEIFDQMMTEWYKGQTDSLAKTGRLNVPDVHFKIQLPESTQDDERFKEASEKILEDPFIKADFLSAFTKYTTLAAQRWEEAKADPTEYEFPHIFETKTNLYFLAQTLNNFGFMVKGIIKEGHDRAGTLVEVKASKDVSAKRLARKREKESMTNWNHKSKMMNAKGIFRGQAPTSQVPFWMNFKHGLEDWLLVQEAIKIDGYITEVKNDGRAPSVQAAMKLLRGGITMKSVGYHNCALSEESIVVDLESGALVLKDFSASAWEEEDGLKKDIDKWERSPCFLMMNENSAVRLEATPDGKTVWRDDTSRPIEDELAILWMVYKLLEPIDDEPIDLFAMSMPDPQNPAREINYGEYLSNPEKSCTGMYFGKGAKAIVEQEDYPKGAQYAIAVDANNKQQGNMCSAKSQETTLRLLEQMFTHATKNSKMNVLPMKDLLKPSQRSLMRRAERRQIKEQQIKNLPPPLPPGREKMPPLGGSPPGAKGLAGVPEGATGGSTSSDDELPKRRDNQKEETTEQQKQATKLKRQGAYYGKQRTRHQLIQMRHFRSPAYPHSYKKK